MSPSRVQDDDDDPVTATYDVYLTPAQSEQILLLQYPNRVRTRPYNKRHGGCPEDVRVKPSTGFIEVDVGLNTTFNFNKYKGLQWGDALQTSHDLHGNATGTYGPAAGFGGAKPRSGGVGRQTLKDSAARDTQIANDLLAFYDAESDKRVLRTQTLGGQITRHDAPEEAGKPVYFVGAFRDDQLHLTKVDGTAHMRPQFHHLDAEEQRARISASRAAALENPDARPPGEARSILAREKKVGDGWAGDGRDRLEDRTRKQLQEAEAEEWVKLEYVDEDMQDAYDKFAERMFVRDVEGAARLKSGMGGWEYLDAVSAPRRDSPTRRRKRPPRRRAEVADEGDGGGEVDVTGGGAEAGREGGE
ncbi:hypothetical protein B0A55_04926 [Friedmanniomyces simplex]|uniref:Uncharacterized protein n=1 Tax=Friedmanniomyces simplex TaxID=329884 RepID=A0A4U0XHQ7_9PEZI|nr:hypothetical protein B0A55_04926 [Friedmanniomyces simplex]